MSMPWVRVSRPLVKYCTPPIVADAGVGQERQGGVVVEGGAEDDAVVDPDVEVVRGDREVVDRREGHAGAEVERGLLLSGTAPSASAAGWSTGKTPTSTNWSAITLVIDLAERHLAQARGPEAGARGRAEAPPPGRLVAQRHLAREPLAEVAVALEARGHVGQHLLAQVGLRVGVEAEVVPVPLGGVVGREAGEDRGAGRRRRRAVLIEVEAVDVRGQLALADLVALPPERRAEGEVDRRGQPHLHRPGHVDRGDELPPQQPPAKNSVWLGIPGSSAVPRTPSAPGAQGTSRQGPSEALRVLRML